MKKKINMLSMSFNAISANESLARVAVISFLMPYSPTVEEIADIKTSVSEAVTNAIVHGYRGREAEKVALKAYVREDGVFSVSVSDTGCGIADVHKAMEPMYTTDPEGERSGMGFSIIETFMDKVRVTSREGVGTRVTMTKRLSRFSVR
jgi:stage II sporulation protein AB (anti-sigma F factor)